MPNRGYRKPDARTKTIRFRVTPIEDRAIQIAWERAKADSLSDWLRDLALAEAAKLGVIHAENDADKGPRRRP